jgi:hypothetical protein
VSAATLTTPLRLPGGLVATRASARRAAPMALVLLAGLVLRVLASERSLWLDETISVLQTDRPLAEVVGSQVNGFHPPLFHVLLHGWIELFGTSAAAVRSLSIAWSLVAVVAIWGWSREAYPDASAIPAAALAAISPFAVWYGSEARMYAQLLALVAVAGWIAWRIAGRGITARRAVAMAAALVALAYTHYFASLFFASLGIVMLALACGRPELRRRALAVVGALAVAAVALVPWLAHVLAARSEGGSLPAYPEPDVFSVLIAGAEMVLGFHSYDTMGLVAAGWPLLCLALLLALPLAGRVSWRTGGLIALVVAPAGLLVLASAVAPGSYFDPRYLTVSTAPLYVLAGRAWAGLPGGRARLAVAAVAVAALSWLGVRQGTDASNPRLYELREVIDATNRIARPGDVLVVVPQFTVAGVGEDPILSYYRPRPGLRVVSTITPSERRPDSAWQRARAAGARRIVLITSFEEDRASLAAPLAFDRYFSARGHRVARRPFANVNLTIFDIGGRP